MAGVAAYVKQVRPDVKVYGVEAEDAAGMTASLEAGKPVVLDHVGLFADGAAVKAIGQETFKLCDKYVDGMITVDNDEICAAPASLWHAALLTPSARELLRQRRGGAAAPGAVDATRRAKTPS